MNYSISVEPQDNVIVQVLNPIEDVVVATPGIQGPRGYGILSGNGYPDNQIGRNTELYLDLDSGFLYKKLAGVWEYQYYTKPQYLKVTISAQDVLNKSIILSPPPNNPDSVTLSFVGGTVQENGVEFKVLGNILSWAANPSLGVTGLEGFIEENDVLIVQY